MRSEIFDGAFQLEDIAPFARAAEAGEWRDLIAHADHAAQRLIGHRFCSVMRFFPEAMELERVYSSVPSSYPCGVRKSKRGTVWGEKVLLRGEVFWGRDENDIRANFDDHEKLIGMGLGAIINTPIKLGGKVLGTFNVMNRAGWYRDGDQHVASALAYLMAPALLTSRSFEAS